MILEICKKKKRLLESFELRAILGRETLAAHELRYVQKGGHLNQD